MVFSYSRVMRRESIWFILAVPGHMWMSWQRRARKIVVTRVKEDTGKSQLWRGHFKAHVHTRPTDRLEYSSGSNCRFQIRPGGKDGWNESTAGCRYTRVFSMFCYGGKAVDASLGIPACLSSSVPVLPPAHWLLLLYHSISVALVLSRSLL